MSNGQYRGKPKNLRQKIFITGGAGFIGANLVKHLLEDGCYDITVYDNLSVCSKKNLDKAIKNSPRKEKVNFIKGDILNKSRLNQAIKGHNAVVHLAAHTRVIESIKNPEENFKVNSVGTFNVLEASRMNRIKKFVFASSNAAVGEQKPPINEKTLPRPISPYGASKLYGEALCSAYFQSYGLRTVSLRFANVYGPYANHKNSVIARFIKRIKQSKPLEVYGDGNQTRDFIHASDICKAIRLCLSMRRSQVSRSNHDLWGEILQIATGKETKIIDLADTITNLFNPKKKNIRFTPERKGEIKRNYSDIRKANSLLGFKPGMRLPGVS